MIIPKCEIRWCTSGKPGMIFVTETIGDGAWSVIICDDCANTLNLRQYDDLPNSDVVKALLVNRPNDKDIANPARCDKTRDMFETDKS